MNNIVRRKLQDVNEILHFAKLSEDDVIATSQALFFTSNHDQAHNFRLMEINNDLLNAIKENQNVCIKGEDDDEVVICTKNSTLHVIEAETSNSLLLVKPIKYYNSIQADTERVVHNIEGSAIFQEYLQINIGKPHLKKLHSLLNDTIYKGPEHEYELQNRKLYSLRELKSLVQASDEELLDALNCMDVVEIDGKIRKLDFEFHFRVLSFMLKLIEENSWHLDGIDFDETCGVLKDVVPLDVLKGLFEKYTEESRMIDRVQFYRYKETKVCTFFARVLLKEAGKFNLNDFLQAWKGSVPEGMVPNEDMLHGIAILNKKSSPNVICAFEEDVLPDNIEDRFKVLFEAKDKWSVPEITPYIRQLATKQQDVNALLAKHARASKVEGFKYYSAKHAK